MDFLLATHLATQPPPLPIVTAIITFTFSVALCLLTAYLIPNLEDSIEPMSNLTHKHRNLDSQLCAGVPIPQDQVVSAHCAQTTSRIP